MKFNLFKKRQVSNKPARMLSKFHTFDWLPFSKNYSQYVANRNLINSIDQHFNCKTKSFLVVSDDGKDLRWQIAGPLDQQIAFRSANSDGREFVDKNS
jgi:hypothetical protein